MPRKRKPLDALGQPPLVAQLFRSEPSGLRHERLLAVQLGCDSANDLDQVAAAVGRARSTVQLWFDAYRKGGVEALLKDGRADNSGRPDTFGPEVRQALEEGLKEGRWRTVPKMHADLHRDFGITLKMGSLYNRLGKAGVRLRVPRPRHTLQNPAQAALFREELCVRLEDLNLPAKRPVRLWVLDEMRHGLHGFTARLRLDCHRALCRDRGVARPTRTIEDDARPLRSPLLGFGTTSYEFQLGAFLVAQNQRFCRPSGSHSERFCSLKILHELTIYPIRAQNKKI